MFSSNRTHILLLVFLNLLSTAWALPPGACVERLVRLGTVSLAGGVAAYDAVGAYYSYDTKQKISHSNSTDTEADPPLLVATTLQGASAVLLTATIPISFLKRKGPDTATLISLISFTTSIAGSVANFAAYGLAHRHYPIPFWISLGGTIANFLPLAAYFIGLRAVVDRPGPPVPKMPAGGN